MGKNKTGGGVGTNGSAVRGTAKGTPPRRGRPEDHPAFKDPATPPPAWQAAFDAFDDEPDEPQPAPWPAPTEPARHVVVDPFSELQEEAALGDASRPADNDDGGLTEHALRRSREIGAAYAEAARLCPDAPFSAHHEIAALTTRMRALKVDPASAFSLARQLGGENATGRQVLDHARLIADMAARGVDPAAAFALITENQQRKSGPKPKPAIRDLAAFACVDRDFGRDAVTEMAMDNELPMAHIWAARKRGLQPRELAEVLTTFTDATDRERYLTLRATGRSGPLRYRRGRTHQAAGAKLVREANRGRRRSGRPKVTLPGVEERRRVTVFHYFFTDKG